ncbi:translation elongation factor Ts [Porphyromonas sp. COT-290 OH3588]|uniref:translation elongation factor Ts n=1 Tax=Porphyromonas sp. COT-290 OH3588 TaxID=1515617 RepID=UPI00052B93A1|nr:translation elongation factor Ts [Porphyromonas sp. COT-290 OH3588]KGO01215.1 elongation factor Ts [Porphyromonas sp. COT-290 OH3588]
MAVSIQDIAKLRKMTGAGMMDVKKALEEAAGDFDKAIEIIRKRGQAIAAKRSDRDAEEGCVLAAHDGDFAVVVGIKCETDFVAKNEDFINLAKAVLAVATEKRGASKEEILAAPMADGRSVQEHITERSGVTGEKMELGIYEFVKGAAATSYIHPGNMLATIVAFNEAIDAQVARDVAMQIAAMNPVGITEADVPAEIKERELEIAREKAREAGKPENLIDHIAQGALKKYYKENTLLEQEFVKDNKKTIGQYLHEQTKTLAPTAFYRASLVAE